MSKVDVARFDEPRVLEALREVIDPELGIDAVELGMIGNVAIEGGDILVELRLTSMSCPFWDLFVDQVKTALRDLDGVGEVTVRFDRSRAWSPELLSEQARAQLEATGLLPPRLRGGPAGPPELIQLAAGVLAARRQVG
jgi:metal-sulfur cluster biosynthetic enzyme